MVIKIACKKPGFRRCGMEHPAEATYPGGKFTPAQLRELKAEPMLVVVEVEGDVPAEKPAGKKGPKAE
ncbi:MAG: hypothetical protein FJ087_01595 [Deltaproteobacteria bacterium]|nr:hypothetical protein [Deltaproteobacteria bacterium]